MNRIDQIEYEEKKSKFIAILVRLDSAEDSKKALEELKAEHPKARHILRVLRAPNQFGVIVSEASEDREPISSMKKAKDLMERKNIKNVGVYVVRYYGGTNLGASRLDHVYFTLVMNLINKLS